MLFKKRILFLCCMCTCCFILFAQTNRSVVINTSENSLIFTVTTDGKLLQSYYGDILSVGEATEQQNFLSDAYPAYGTSYINTPALRLVHADGNTSTELRYINHKTQRISENIEQTVIELNDTYYALQVKLYFKAYWSENIIEQWMEISHTEDKSIVLYDFASTHLAFSEQNYFLTQFYGNWAEEMKMEEKELTRGQKILSSRLGNRSNQYAHACCFVSFNGMAQEDAGRVMGAALAYSGSWNLTFDVDERENLHLLAGINPYASQYMLQPNEIFKTPSFLYSYSSTGTGSISRNFHHWAKKYGIYNGEKTRMTLLNNWEATYFDFDEKILTKIIQDASDMGFELFLLDDGWFGNKYARNNDNAGLGDWEVNKKKLPHGLGYLVKEAEKNSIKFGIWLEPEMVNPQSELYEKHPNWVIGQPHRSLDLLRQQLMLDLSNPEVQDFVFLVIDRTLDENQEIAYVKWDCNRYMTNAGSYYLSPEKQSHLFIEYIRGLYSVLERVRAKYKDVSFMLCSGGGGRIDYGVLPYFDEYWISDNTDAVDRIFIQWGATQFFPAMALASHVSVVPNHITGRTTPLKFRFDVAMSAKLGMDLQPKDMSPEDKSFAKNAIQEYYKIRNIVQFGNLYRLLSPYKSTRTAMMYVAENKNEAVVFSYLLKKTIQGNMQPLILKGLDPQKRYKLTEINKDTKQYSWFSELEGKTFTGAYLMEYGLRFAMYNEYDSKIIKLTVE